jgi:hypothetical protein
MPAILPNHRSATFVTLGDSRLAGVLKTAASRAKVVESLRKAVPERNEGAGPSTPRDASMPAIWPAALIFTAAETLLRLLR